MKTLIHILPWISIILLPFGYWKQVWHIHKHKEVRDLSLSSYFMFLFTYISLVIESISINSSLFLWKNVLAILPTVVIIIQIFIHKEDKWEDEYERIAEKQDCNKIKILHRNINMRDKK